MMKQEVRRGPGTGRNDFSLVENAAGDGKGPWRRERTPPGETSSLTLHHGIGR